MEEFRIIPGYENYSVTQYGLIKNINKNDCSIYKPFLDEKNYLHCECTVKHFLLRF